MYFFTSINSYYLPKAYILASSLKKVDKDAKFILVLSDDLPDNIKRENEPFDDIIFADTLEEFKRGFFFQYNVTELCTAVKPYSAKYIMEKYNAEAICYLDPDIQVFSELIELKEILKKYSIVVTPHNTAPEEKQEYIVGNEILFLKRGTYNFGFFAVRNDEEGIKFLNWWHSRLQKYCVDDKHTVSILTEQAGYLGCFTDQKWGDLIPSFFDKYHILKHPGYNLSTWNITTKKIEYKNNIYLINGYPLRFFHFSGFDSRAHHYVLSVICNDYPHLEIVKNISGEYERLHNKLVSNDKLQEWKYARFKSGEKIRDDYRRIYLISKDIQETFIDPFDDMGDNNFKLWANTEYGRYITGNIANLPVNDMQKTRKIKYHFDIKKIYGNRIEITGWAFLSKEKITGKVYLGFKDDEKNTLIYDTNAIYRYDVADCFGDSSLSVSGFSLYADVDKELSLSSIIIQVEDTYYIKNIVTNILGITISIER